MHTIYTQRNPHMVLIKVRYTYTWPTIYVSTLSVYDLSIPWGVESSRSHQIISYNRL